MLTDLKTGKCLIVDDSEENLATISRLMKKFDFSSIVLARSGEEALAILQNERNSMVWDLILMDISMPGMGGIDASARIKSDEELRDIPIIILTGHAVEEFLSPAFEVGVNDYLSRPIRKIELLARVKAALRLKQAINRRKQTISDLRDTLNNIKTLKGLLPICANCKKIRDDSGYWQQVESYVQSHTQASFSESICPDCQQELAAGEIHHHS